tara:strand:- start:7980 stop:9971 length:1992 start_codon:yes stop_codon:yes gene_type:complete
MAESSRYYKIDDDILLEVIYHDQSDPSSYEIEVDDNGSEIKILDTVQGDSTQARHLIHELGSLVVNFDVTEDGAYVAVEGFAARTLLLEAGKTYKFNLSALSTPADFSITGTNNGAGLSGTTFIYVPATTGSFEYKLTNYTGGKITVGNTANPLFATPDEETGNSIVTGSGSIERYHAVKVNENKYALLDSTNVFIDSVEWTGSDSADLLTSQTNATTTVNTIKYDKVRLHLRSGFSFAARGYEGFMFEVKTNRTSGVQNFLTQTVYLNTSSFEIKNPRPFILSETLYSNFIEIKLPTLKSQYSDFEDLFYDNGAGASDLDTTSNYDISLKLIDSIEDTAGIDYIYTGEETNFIVAQEDEFQDFTVAVEEATDGDYFKIYGEKDNSAADFEAYIINRIATSSDDISVIFDIIVNEQIGTSFIETYATSITQTQDFEEPIQFRPIIQNANNAASFMIDITMRIYNQTDNTQIVKRGSLISTNAPKYGKRMMKVNIASSANLTRVYNTLPNLQATRNVAQVINSSLPKAQVKYAPAFIERLNVVVNVGNVTIDDGQITSINNDNGLEISPFDTFIKFNISKIDGGERKAISFTNLKCVKLNFADGIYFNNITSFKDVDLSKGEVLFKIDKANAAKLQGLNNKKYYISIDNGSTETMVFKGEYAAI